MNIYQLEYRFLGKYTGLTKGRSFFYRPQHIVNPELWNEIKSGKEIITMKDIKTAQELDQLRLAKKAKKFNKVKYK